MGLLGHKDRAVARAITNQGSSVAKQFALSQILTANLTYITSLVMLCLIISLD